MDEVITFVEKLIPDISQTQFSLLRSRFEDIGISTIENLTYLNVEDLTDILKLVPARRFIAEVKRRLNIADVGNLSSASAESTYQTDHSTSTWLLNSSATGSASSASSSFSDDTRSGSPSITQLWSQSFNIPWEKFSKSFLEDCEKKKRPDESMRREAIRILCQSMREVCTKPNSKDIHVIAAKFVNEYKESLGDMIMGKMIGNGYSSVLSSMTERLNNLNRKTSNGPSIEYDSSKVSSQKYGCLSTWSIDIDSEEEQGMVEKRDWMKNEFMKSKNTSCLSTITEYMKETYPLQRKTINTGSTDDVRKDFPYLFEKQFMAVHFERLTGHSLDNYKKSEKKKFSVIHFLRKEKSPVLRKAIADMDFYVKETNHHIKLIAFVKLLMVSFKEDGLLEFYQPCIDTKQVEAVQRKDGAPVIAVIGDLYSPVLHHVVLENKIVSTVDTIDDAVMIMFGIYYIFNLEYHPKATQTLEFIQRVLIGINPDFGSKKPKKSTKKGCVSSKVITLASHLDEVDVDQHDY